MAVNKVGKRKSKASGRHNSDVAESVHAGREVAVPTVDFSDPNRPKTCLEVDFPILPVNLVASLEGSSGATRKPVYQVTKWWARRNSSVFRAILLAAATRATSGGGGTSKEVWDSYYQNHKQKKAFSQLKVADIFMGGGTTVVEGSRLGMQMFGLDLNPVAWFCVKNSLLNVDQKALEVFLTDLETEVRRQIIPFYTCDCPRGHRGKWYRILTSGVREQVPNDFDPLRIDPEERRQYDYDGPEIVYTFWAKHGPCQTIGCGHRTPIITNPIVAVKNPSIKAWEHLCSNCGGTFDIEREEARMAPGVPLVVAVSEAPFTVMDKKGAFTCPHCQYREAVPLLQKSSKKKRVQLSLLIHPDWLAGVPKCDKEGQQYGGSPGDPPDSTIAWHKDRARACGLIEVRGELTNEILCPETGRLMEVGSGTVPKKSNFACGACGSVQDVLSAVKASGKAGAFAAYAIEGYCPECKKRFFAPADSVSSITAIENEWASRRDCDLQAWWPRGELPFGFMTHLNNGGLPNHGYSHWWKMFNTRQLVLHATLLRAICCMESEGGSEVVREYVLGAFQQYLRNQCMFTIWNSQAGQLEPLFSNDNFHPKATCVENNFAAPCGRGNWRSCASSLVEALDWRQQPWEWFVSGDNASGKRQGIKIACSDSVETTETLRCGSATSTGWATEMFDLVITDPPFGGLLHYSELSDFFYVWLRMALAEKYPDCFGNEYVPKALEVVANRARNPQDADSFYQRLLTASWKEASRILKLGGILAFTFHHSDDEPWVAVLESLFDAGFYLEATYPIRSDETKGEGAKPGTFGSQTIEYDIIHVCRKRIEDPTPVSWARMRREVLDDIRQLQGLLEHHAKSGLPAADLKVIKRGKALEYFSRHYGKVYVDEGREFTVRDALIGINQLIDEESDRSKEMPPPLAEPFTRQFLRCFGAELSLARDQLQKFLRGTGIAPQEFAERGWCKEEKKICHVVSPLEFARAWIGKHRTRLSSDYDQALLLVGACIEGSGINAQDTLNNMHFMPHPALESLLDWIARKGVVAETRSAANRALTLLRLWKKKNTEVEERQMSFFGEA